MGVNLYQPGETIYIGRRPMGVRVRGGGGVIAPATYYVDATGGSDSNGGTATGSAWATIAKVNAATLNPGDTVLFKRGEVWRESMVMPSSGVSGRPITISAYGTGNNPKLYGADTYASWTLHSGSIYRVQITGSTPNQVFQDGARLTRKTSTGSMTAGSYFYDSGTGRVYVQSTDNADPGTHLIEISRRTHGIDFNGKSWINVNNIDTSHYNLNGFSWQTTVGAHDINVDGCVSSWNCLRGFGMGGYELLAMSNIRITNCIAHNTVGEGFWIGNGSNLGIEDCEAYNCGNDRRDKSYTAIGDGGGVVVGIRSVDCYVRNSYIRDIGYKSGVLIEYEATYDRPLRTILDGNLITTYTTGSNGGALSAQGDSSIITNNIIRGNQARNLVQCLNGSVGEILYHNTIYQTSANAWCVALTEASGTILKNNIIVNNQNGAMIIAESDSQSGFVSDRNLYYGSAGNSFWTWTTGFQTTLTAWRTSSGNLDANSVESDPLFVNAATFDFHLQSSSPARNLGANLGVLVDYDATVRDAVTPDVGAFEFV